MDLCLKIKVMLISELLERDTLYFGSGHDNK
jgi:hypothetical protein